MTKGKKKKKQKQKKQQHSLLRDSLLRRLAEVVPKLQQQLKPMHGQHGIRVGLAKNNLVPDLPYVRPSNRYKNKWVVTRDQQTFSILPSILDGEYIVS